MPGVKYIAPFLDGSGYAEAARNYALAIHKKGYPITLAPISFEKTRPNLGREGEVLRSLINKPVEYDKIIVHSTPDLWRQWTQFEANKYIIGYTVWETSRLHEVWVNSCNKVNEVWVPCEWNIEVFKDSGVKAPLHKIPHAIDLPDLEKVPDYNLEGVPADCFVFYSVFQWQERKNPYGLLTAFNAAFTGIDDVVLVMKTYKADQGGDQDSLKQAILDFRTHLNLRHYPKLYLIVENLSTENMVALHKRGDCFVLLQRSEGWGLPHFEAASLGKPIITPSYGGQVDFLKPDNSYLVDYVLCPVSGMSWSPYYRSDQLWCEPNTKQAMDLMKHVYHNRKEATEKGLRAREYIAENYTWEIIGDLIVKRLGDLDKEGRIYVSR